MLILDACGWHIRMNRKAPKNIERFDASKSSVKGSQDHVHFKNGSALNKDGTWKDGKAFKLSNNEKKYLQQNGWKIDKTK